MPVRHIFYPRRRNFIPSLVLATVSSLFVGLQVGDLTGSREIVDSEVVYVAWLVLLTVSSTGLLLWMISACWPSRPWFEIDQRGITDRTPLGLGQVDWDEVTMAVIGGLGLSHGRSLGFYLRNSKQVIARRSFPVRTYLRFELFVHGEPVLRVQETGIKGGIGPLFQEIAKHTRTAHPAGFTLTLKRPAILLTVGLGILGVSLWPMSQGWIFPTVLTLSIGWLLTLCGIFGFGLEVGRGSRLGAIVGLWLLAVLTVFGGLVVSLSGRQFHEAPVWRNSVLNSSTIRSDTANSTNPARSVSSLGGLPLCANRRRRLPQGLEDPPDDE